VLCADDDELVPQKEKKELKKVIETPQRNRAQKRRFEAEKGERERERDAKIRLIRHGLQCCKTSCLSASTSFNAPGHWNFILHAAAVSYAPDQKRSKGRQVEGALVSTTAVFYAPDKQKDNMHQKTSGPWLSGVNKFSGVTNSSMQKERKKERKKLQNQLD
jgi:hypothetical protein